MAQPIKEKLSPAEMSAAKYNRMVESYQARYESQLNKIAKSPSLKGGLSNNDIYNLGSQIDMYKKYEAYVTEENSSASSLGMLPNVALDLITAQYALSIAPQLTSVQTIDDDHGMIYYKGVTTSGYPYTARSGLEALPQEDAWMNEDGTVGGSATMEGAWKKWHDHRAAIVGSEGSDLGSEDLSAKNADAVTFAAFQGWKASPSNYMSERQFVAVAGTTATIKYGLTSLRYNIPINIRLVKTADKSVVDVVGISAGQGQLPVFYGSVTVTAVASGSDIVITVPAGYEGLVAYDVDFEKAQDIPAIEYHLDTKMVTAEIIGLKELIGTFKSFQFNKRFGKAASDEVLSDLTGHLAQAESEKIIKAYSQCANSFAPVTWDINRGPGISEFEHRQSFAYAIQQASSLIGRHAGKGRATKCVAGYVACQYIQALPGFRAAPKTNTVGPQVFGTLENEGITIIQSYVGVSPNEMILAYASELSPFEAPVVAATYMPVFVTDTMPVANNPFQSQRAIASWKAITPVVPEFVQRLVLTNKANPPADVNVFLTGTPAQGGSGSN